MSSRPSLTEVKRAVWDTIDIIHNHRSRDADSDLDDLLARHRRVIESFSPLYRDWVSDLLMYYDDDARPVLRMLEYYSGFCVDHPLLDRVCEVQLRLEERFPFAESPDGKPIGPGVCELISVARPTATYYLLATPRNCLTFYGTGGDGVHYAFLTADRRVSSNCPIVMVDPEGPATHVVAEDLTEFLELGLAAGTWFDLVHCHKNARIAPPAPNELAPRLAEFAEALEIAPRTPSPERLNELNEQFSGDIQEPWAKTGLGIRNLTKKRGFWFHVRRRIRRYAGV